jgi:hypothetical protein
MERQNFYSILFFLALVLWDGSWIVGGELAAGGRFVSHLLVGRFLVPYPIA